MVISLYKLLKHHKFESGILNWVESAEMGTRIWWPLCINLQLSGRAMDTELSWKCWGAWIWWPCCINLQLFGRETGFISKHHTIDMQRFGKWMDWLPIKTSHNWLTLSIHKSDKCQLINGTRDCKVFEESCSNLIKVCNNDQ